MPSYVFEQRKWIDGNLIYEIIHKEEYLYSDDEALEIVYSLMPNIDYCYGYFDDSNPWTVWDRLDY